MEVWRGSWDETHSVETARRLHFRMVTSASRGDVDTLRRMLDKGADVNYADYDSRTALHLASTEGHEDTVKLLLSHGANFDVVDRFGSTAVDDALRNHRVGVLRLLEMHGAPVKTKLVGRFYTVDAPPEDNVSSRPPKHSTSREDGVSIYH